MLRSTNTAEQGLFSYIQAQQRTTIQNGEVGAVLGLTRAQENKLLSGLTQRGVIARVRRGLYLVPSALPAQGCWSPTDAEALTTLMTDCSAQYQVCGANAFYRYRWDDQVPNRLYAYNDKLSGDRQIGPVTLTLIKVPLDKLGAVEVVPRPNGVTLSYSSRARALVDAMYDWSRFYGLPRAYKWVRKEIKSGQTAAAELIELAIRYGDQETLRRMGLALEDAGVADSLLCKLEQQLQPYSSTILRVPFLPSKGEVNKRWGVRINYK